MIGEVVSYIAGHVRMMVFESESLVYIYIIMIGVV